jgi:RecB family endonuclease NucS
MNKPYVWQMIREAIAALGGRASNVQVRDWILARYPETNQNTISAQTIVCTVNHASRVHYPENQKPRLATTKYDFLYRPEKGRLETYEPSKHGQWEIRQTEDGRLVVIETGDGDFAAAKTEAVALVPVGVSATIPEGLAPDSEFAEEVHLRDYLATNPGVIEEGLQVYVDDDGQAGIEYSTPIGRIDLLCKAKSGEFVVVELKVSRGPDAVAGQLLRYRSWVKKNLAGGARVRGYVIARQISDRIRYAFYEVPDVSLKEYELVFRLSDVVQL